jgi:hypothetical protein
MFGRSITPRRWKKIIQLRVEPERSPNQGRPHTGESTAAQDLLFFFEFCFFKGS